MQTEKSKKRGALGSYRFIILLIVGIVTGCIIGLIFKEKAVVLKPFGELFLNLMFTVVVPLVFFSLSSSIAKMTNMERLGKILKHSLIFFVITGIIASIFIIIILTIFPPAQGINISLGEYEKPEEINFLTQIVQAVSVNDFNLILSKKAMLPLIIFSIALGYCIRLVIKDSKDNPVITFFDTMSEAFMKMINLIMLYAPIGLGAYFAALVGDYGTNLIGAYSRAIIMFFPICILYFLIGFTAYVYYAAGMEGVKVFYKNIFPAVVTSLATQSSIATLPTNLSITKKIGVKDDISSIILPLGATIHMDGTVLTSLMKIAFLFGIFGLDFKGIGVWTTAVLLSILTGVVLSGIPSGGMMGDIMIVSFYGFNQEVLPIIVTIGLLTDAIATMINSTGDTVVCMMVSRTVDGKDWLEKAKLQKTVDVVE